MKYNRIRIDKFLVQYDQVLPDDLRGAALLLKSRGRKCVFVEHERMKKIIELQQQIVELKQKTKI